MMKNKELATGIVVVIFAVYSTLIFVLLGSTLPGFWLGYACSILSAGFCAVVIWKGFGERRSSFMGLPLATLTFIYFIIQLLASFIVSFLPIMTALVVEVILLGIYLICALGTLMGRNIVDGREVEIKEKVFYIKSIAGDIEALVSRTTDQPARKKLIALFEAVRYSDPMSQNSLAPIEQRIAEQAVVLSEQVDTGDWQSVSSLCDTLIRLVEERNRKCKLLK